ncbi:MAG: DNA-processing protein DprA [Nocardioides sp.]
MSRLDDRLARAALSRLAEPGDVRLTALVAELGAVRVHELLLSGNDDDGLADDVASRLTRVDPVRELEQAERLGLRFVTPADDEWPHQLRGLEGVPALHERGGVPVGLWVRGPLPLNEVECSVAVVGARASTSYGDTAAGEIGGCAALADVAVISGAAFGIDVAAHRGALAVGGQTVAVLACGADRIYPGAHAELIGHIARTGAVVSEAPPGCAPQRIRFLARNRLIAALARGTVVVEAARRSGALNTANWATRLNRPLMGVPGPVTSAASAGIHEQIRHGAMALVTSGADVLELVGQAGEHLVEQPASTLSARDRLGSRQRQVLDAVPVSTPALADSIARVAGMRLLDVRSALTKLERAGLVASEADGWRLAGAARD